MFWSLGAAVQAFLTHVGANIHFKGTSAEIMDHGALGLGFIFSFFHFPENSA